MGSIPADSPAAQKVVSSGLDAAIAPEIARYGVRLRDFVCITKVEATTL